MKPLFYILLAMAFCLNIFSIVILAKAGYWLFAIASAFIGLVGGKPAYDKFIKQDWK